MAELAIASGIAGLCSLVIDAERTILDYLAALRGLEAVLVELDDVAQTPSLTRILASRPEALSRTAIQDCKKHVLELNSKLSKRMAEDGHLKLCSTLSWPLKKKQTLESIRLLQQYRDTFHTVLSSDTMRISIATHSAVQASKDRMEREQLLTWLTEDSIRVVLQSMSLLRHPGTCTWFFEQDTFKEWVLGSTKTMWCHGAPGTGKSVLASAVVEKLREEATCILHVFDQQRPDTQPPEAVLRSLIKQIVLLSDDIPPKLWSMFKEQQKGGRASSPTKGQLLAVFEGLCGQSARMFVVFDGLDECENRRQIIQLITSVASAGAKILVTSRKLPDIEEDLQYSCQAEHIANDEDLKSFIHEQLEVLEAELGEDLAADFRDSVSLQILTQSNGVFLLCWLIMADLQSSINIAQLRRSLDTLPANLSEMYQKTTDRLSAQVDKGQSRATLALQTLSRVAFSVRPLHIEEVRHALAFESNATDINRENLTSPRIIISACLGLLQTDESGQCVFVHLTAYDFFRHYFDADEVNYEIARTCVGYLNLKAFADRACHDQQSMNQRLQRYPFALYSAQCLEVHIRSCEADLLDELMSVLRHPISLRSLSQFFYYRHRKDESLKSQSFDSLPTGKTAVQFASGAGLSLAVRTLLDAGADVNVADDQGWAPLHAAASYGQPRVIELLMERQASIEQPDNFGWTPLFWSTFKGHHDTTQMLLTHGASIRASDSSSWTPLHWAACKGDETMIRILNTGSLRENAMTLTKKWNRFLAKALRPFFLAAERNNVESLNALVTTSGLSTLMPQGSLSTKPSRGAEAEDETLQERNKILYRAIGKEPNYLHHSSRMHPSLALPESFLLQLLDSAIHANHLDLVRMVLERDIKLTSGSYGELKGRSILHTAAFCTEAQIPSLLIQKGISTLQVDEDGYYPVDLAALNGSEPVIRVFMEEPNAKQAVSKSQVLMHFLWENENLLAHLHSNSEDETDDTEEELRRIQTLSDVRLALAADLIGLGAGCMARHNGGTILHSVVFQGTAVVDFFVSRKVDINAQDEEGSTVLHLAFNGRDYERIQQQMVPHLISLGADCNIPDSDGQTPLLLALRFVSYDLARLLIERGAASTDIRDEDGYNCLHAIGAQYFAHRDNKHKTLAFVQYLADACEPRAAVERCNKTDYSKGRYPFELAFPERESHDSTLCRALFERALQADRKLVEDFLADEELWAEAGPSYRIARDKERQTYRDWMDDVDHGESIFKETEQEPEAQNGK